MMIKSSRENPDSCLLPATYSAAHFYVNMCHSKHTACTLYPQGHALSPEHSAPMQLSPDKDPSHSLEYAEQHSPAMGYGGNCSFL